MMNDCMHHALQAPWQLPIHWLEHLYVQMAGEL